MSVTTVTKTWSEWKLYGAGYAWSTWYIANATITLTRNTGSDTATVQVDASMTTTSGDNSLGAWECVISINGASSGGGEKTFVISNAGLHIKNTAYTASQTYTVGVGVSAGTLTGTIKMHLAGYSGNQGEYSPSQEWSLTYDTKGTPSQATWSNYYFGNSSTITIQRTVPDFRETVELVWQDDTSHPVTIRTYSQSSATTISYTIPYNTLPYNATTRSAKIRVVTYNGSTQIGTWETSAVSVTIKTGDTHYNPTLSANPTCEAYNDVVSALGTDTAVAQYSKLNVKAKKSNVVVSTDCPSGQTITIASRVVTFSNGSSASADQENHISSIITSAGTVTWTYTVTDSRGLKVTRTGSYTVINSSAPTISNVTVYRGNSSGTAVEGGDYIYATATATCESLNGHNSVTLQGKVDSGSWQSMTSGTRKTLMTNADENTQYVVTLQATDLLRPTTQTIILPSKDVPFDIPETKHGVGIGMQGTSDDTLSVGYDAKFYGDLVKHDVAKNIDVNIPKAYEPLVAYGTAIPANSNLNTASFVNAGLYYVEQSATASTLTNCPTPNAFTMIVRNITKTYTDTQSRAWQYIVREIIAINGDMYEQRAYVEATAGSWTFGAWYWIDQSLASEGGNVAQWLKASVRRPTSLDFTHIYDSQRVHARLDQSSSSLSDGVNSIFGEGYVLTFMWDTNAKWDSQFFIPDADGAVPAYRCFVPSQNQWGAVKRFVTMPASISESKVNVTQLTDSALSVNTARGGCYYQRIGNVVEVNVSVSGATTGWKTVFTLPAEYRPSTSIYTIAQTDNFDGSGELYIGNGGTVEIKSHKGASIFFGFVTYLVN